MGRVGSDGLEVLRKFAAPAAIRNIQRLDGGDVRHLPAAGFARFEGAFDVDPGGTSRLTSIIVVADASQDRASGGANRVLPCAATIIGRSASFFKKTSMAEVTGVN